MKLWGGRFQKTTDALTDDFHSSISFDQRLYHEDIEGSIAHAAMLGAQGIIPAEDADKIIAGLKTIHQRIEAGGVEFDPAAEDIHMNIEKLLIEEIGEIGKRLHTGRSRNDQVALDMKLYTKRQITQIQREVKALLDTLCALGKSNISTIMPGYTHLQKAQPLTLAHHLGAYIEMLRRDYRRLHQCAEAMNESPLGSGALATTTYPLDRMMTAQALGFDSITQNSMDGVSDRDYALELLSDLSILMMHLSRLCEEIILWSSNEFGFIELDDAYATGSSIMPQKKNPDMAELIRGKTGRVYGDLFALLTVMKGLPLAYNKDMQEDKEAVFDAVDTVRLCLPVLTGMLKTVKINAARMYEGAKGGFTNATDAADWLVKKGIPFRDAHEIIGKLVLYAIQAGKNLDELSLAEYQKVSDIFDESIYDAISVEECVEKRLVAGGPSKAAMTAYYDRLSQILDSGTDTE